MPATARHISCNCTCASACTSSYGSGGAGSGSGVCFHRRLPYPALGHCPLHLSCRRLAQLLLCPILVHNSGFGVVHSISSVIAPCKNQRKQARHTREQTNSQPVSARWAVACRHATARDATPWQQRTRWDLCGWVLVGELCLSRGFDDAALGLCVEPPVLGCAVGPVLCCEHKPVFETKRPFYFLQ